MSGLRRQAPSVVGAYWIDEEDIRRLLRIFAMADRCPAPGRKAEDGEEMDRASKAYGHVRHGGFGAHQAGCLLGLGHGPRHEPGWSGAQESSVAAAVAEDRDPKLIDCGWLYESPPRAVGIRRRSIRCRKRYAEDDCIKLTTHFRRVGASLCDMFSFPVGRTKPSGQSTATGLYPEPYSCTVHVLSALRHH